MSVKRGNYYKRKTRDYFEDKGYTVELTEFVCGRPIGKGKIIYQKKDILASDGIAYNEDEFILWNSKSTNTGDIRKVKWQGKEEYKNVKVPSFIKKQIVIWEPRKKPVIVRV